MTLAWLEDLADAWEGGQADSCEVGHGPHRTVIAVTEQFGQLNVYDAPRYQNTEGYCAGDDEVSRALLDCGWWERPASTIVSRIFDHGDPEREVVLDFGSHIGWYSMLAAQAGYAALAVDADDDHLRVLTMNLGGRQWRRAMKSRIVQCRGWIGPGTPVVKRPPAGIRVRLIKSDLEGNEADVVRICGPLIEDRLVDYLLMEISPVFNDRYPAMCEWIVAQGYTADVVPGADSEDLEPIDVDHIGDYVRGIHQLDFLFTRKDL